MRVFYHFAKRFIAGESVEEMLPKVQKLVAEGFSTSIDLLGENVNSREKAEAATRDYLLLLQALHAHGLECNISVKLTNLGYDIDPQFARQNLARLVAEAKRLDGFVRVDMEGSAYTNATLELVAEVHRQIPAIGTVVQAMLRRTPSDVAQLCSESVRVRLVKWAYKESADIAHQAMPQIRQQFQVLVEKLLLSGNYPAIATHDEALITYTKELAKKLNIAPDAFEFQMLYGIRTSLQEQLRQEGWRVRVYVPYGSSWFAYVMRRMRERKENVWFVVKNLFRD